MTTKPQNKTIDKPKDLAAFVHKRLQNNTIEQDFDYAELLEELFECLFYTSLHSEEGELIRVTITFYDPENPQLKARKYQATDKWRFVEFNEPLDYNVNTLVKLAKAADPWSSSLAVYHDDKGKLFVYGMIDQAIHSQSYINYEIDQKPEQPGYFKSTINGIGNISVMTEYDMIATLKQDRLITEYLNVFQSGSVADLIKKLARSLNKNISSYLKKNYPHIDHNDWDNNKAILCRSTLSRILNQVKKYNHGGAILFSNESEHLDIKYGMQYDRISVAMCNLINSKIALMDESDEDEEKDDDDNMTVGHHNNLEYLQSKKRASMNELKGAIRFVSSQSCVDGLVLFDYNFCLQGFGVVIGDLEIPRRIYLSQTAKINPRKLESLPTDKFGTRHRSMFAYCNKYTGSLGFVVSQDGDIRAVTKVGDQLIMWENIQTQKILRSGVFKREKSFDRFEIVENSTDG